MSKKKQAAPWCTIGTLTFELVMSPLNMTTGWEWNYAEHPRMLGKPLLQSVGGKLRKLVLQLRFHHMFTNPQEQLDQLLALGNKRQAVPVVIGEQYYGLWAIEKIPLTIELTDAQATLLSCQVRVEMVEHVDIPTTKKEAQKGFKKQTRFKPF